MHIVIKSETRRYHVAFKQDNSKVFTKGSHKGGLQTVTTCEIFLLTATSGPTLISTGVTTLGSRDKPDSYIGCKEAFERALSTAYFNKRETTAFWKEFRKRHKRIETVKPSCAEKFSNTENFAGRGAQGGKFFPTHGYGGSHSFRKQAKKHPWQRVGFSTGGIDPFRTLYGHCRHEYQDVVDKALGKSPTGRAARDYSKGGLVDVRKLHGLGWQRLVPEPKRDKAEQLRQMYNYHLPSTLSAHRQAENRCHRVGKPITIVNVATPAKALSAMMGGAGAKRVRDIITEADRYKRQRTWLQGLWTVADDGLTAHMKSMQLLAGEKADKLDTELLSRPGITKVLGEYIIDADVFVSAFKVGDSVTSDKFGVGKVVEINGVTLRIQPVLRVGLGFYVSDAAPVKTVMDWEVKKHVGRLRRAWTWLRAMTKIHREDSLPKILVSPDVRYVHSLEYGKISGRELWEVIDRNHCPSCGRIGEFLQGPRGGSCLNIKCILCNQRYWVDPLSQTAKKLDD